MQKAQAKITAEGRSPGPPQVAGRGCDTIFSLALDGYAVKIRCFVNWFADSAVAGPGSPTYKTFHNQPGTYHNHVGVYPWWHAALVIRVSLDFRDSEALSMAVRRVSRGIRRVCNGLQRACKGLPLEPPWKVTSRTIGNPLKTL